jgi:hypothetical protein
MASKTRSHSSKKPLSRKGVVEKPVRNTGMSLLFRRMMQYGIPVLFFGFFFVFLLFYINPAVICTSNGIDIHNYVAAMHMPEGSRQYDGLPFRHLYILELTSEYFREIATTPGGWTNFAVTLLIYACHYPVAGALAVTGLALFFFWIFSLYIQGTGANRSYIFRFVPPLFLLTICAWYELGYSVFLLPVAGALLVSVFYQRYCPADGIKRSLLLSVLFWSGWYFLQWGCLLILIFVMIHELFSKKPGKTSIAIVAFVNGALLYVLDAWLIPLNMTIHWKDFIKLSGLPLIAIVFFPLTSIILVVWSRIWRKAEGRVASIFAIVQTVLFLCLAVETVVWLCKEPVNRDTRTIARTLHNVLNRNWEAVLHEKTGELFKGFPQNAGQLHAFMVHAVDRSLCHTNQLGYKLFTFPQAGLSNDPLLMLQSTLCGGFVNWVVVQDLAMDLGMINTAEKIAGEIMENMGPYPDIMYRRALVQIAKGNRDAAAVYLNKLECMPFYRTEAKRLLKLLDNYGALGSEPRIATMRANMDTTDYIQFTNSYEDVLKNLIKSNPGNKAAFDYLMTYYLQTGRLDGIADMAPRTAALGYTVLPRYWEEALCVYLAQNEQDASVSLSGLRQETVERFNEFARAMLQNNDPAASERLAPEFGDSYFYFSVFGHSAWIPHE